MVESAFIEQIRTLQSGRLPDYSMDFIEKTCEEYPCFHSAFLLKAVYKKQEGEESFQEALPSLATRVLNRSVLYDRVHAQNPISAKTEKEKIVDEELENVLSAAKHLKGEAEEVVTEENFTISETLKEEEEDLKALVDAIQKKQKEQPIETKVKKTKETKKKQVPKLKKVEKVEKEIIINSFTDWLKHKNSLGQTKLEEKPEPKTSTEPIIPIDMAASNEAELLLEVKKSSLKLEDFLVNQIERKQQQREHAGAKSLKIVSETYAKILENQGNIEEAIKVYKELSIKYPKKSSNFARQIENLKNSL